MTCPCHWSVQAAFLVLPVLAWGQGEQLQHGDCANPIELKPGREYIYEKSPFGPGKKQEFDGNEHTLHLFPAEINTVWYRFNAPAEGLVIFEVRPFRQADDYDWMLFKQESTASCDSIFRYGIKPLRSNRARNDLRMSSKTGLHRDYENLHAPPGPGKSYSKPIAVKRGETYLLVLDNIYPGGEGHSIIVHYADREVLPSVTIKGRIIDKVTGKPISAKIYAEEDSTGYSLLEALVDSIPAAFTVEVSRNTAVRLAAVKKDYLLTTLNFRAGTADTSLVLSLEPADKGSRMVLFNIHFLPNKAEFQPDSFSELQRLLEFMQQSADKYIRITGHTNSNVFTSKSWLLDLSVYRAAAVRDYLTGHGIEPGRIRIAGAGGSRPLTESNEMKEAMKNLRVEIELLN
ncbi:OmpA family protein [Anseongella ginsenosidimutans]|uniref:OmpA family protein n=1 Tax=Anseongella ginsenosidimutans TaxID=496056 RepID=A0A4R3KUI1_9SPHI|nr:OmpA family protein [Anseongella ginsenosidimutans]QEC51707.1 OmpA family protein [Anseongella ginsenosidimutans]TCS89067.1 OmpA family protein [Anseongella ginsenosidimutans]